MKILFLRALSLLIMALSFIGFVISVLRTNNNFDIFDLLLLITAIILILTAIFCVKMSLKN